MAYSKLVQMITNTCHATYPDGVPGLVMFGTFKTKLLANEGDCDVAEVDRTRYDVGNIVRVGVNVELLELL